MALDPNIVLPGTGQRIAATERKVGGVLAKTQDVNVGTFDGPAVDAFGRWRVSNPHTIFASKLINADAQPLFWDEDLISGTMATSGPTAAKPFIDWTSTNITAGKRTRQTFRRFNYQPGKSQMILMTGVLELASGVKTGCERRIGLFDDDNGAFFESDAGIIGITTRTNDSGSPVDITVAQASWNLDNLDGDGDAGNPSGVLANWSKAQIFVIDFQWLSIGRVRFGIEIGGSVVYVHEVLTANADTIPWCSTPNLPLRYEIITTTSSGVCSMRLICATVVSEGGEEDIGVTRHKSTGGAAVTCTTDNTIYAIVGIRLKAAYLGATVRALEAALQIQTPSDSGEWILMWNPTIAGAFTYSDLANSAVQTAVGVTANTVTDGTEVDGGFLESTSGGGGSGSHNAALDSSLLLGADIANVPDELVLCFRTNAGTASPEVEGSLTWRELS